MTLVLDETLLGAIPSPSDPRDWQLKPKLDTAVVLPRSYRAPLLAPPLSQGQTGRCVAFSGTGLRQQQERAGGDWTSGWPPLDAQWLYDRAQAIDGLPDGINAGTTIRAALQVLAKQGQPLINKPGTAGSFRIARYWTLPYTAEAIKRAVWQFGPVWIASSWYRPWFRPVSGVMPPAAGPVIGGHARYIFGWDNAVNGGSFLVRNSWGSGWGLNGNSYDAYRQLVPALHDAWSTADVKGDAP